MWTSAARTTEAATRTASTSPAPTCAGDQSQRALRSRDHLLSSDWLQLPRGLGAGRGRARVRGQRRVCRQQRARPLPGHLPQHAGGDIIGLVNCDCVRLHRRRTSRYISNYISRVQGSYYCSCDTLPGAQLGSDGHSCELRDMCEAGSCSHGCYSAQGRAYCTCPEGLQVSWDWRRRGHVITILTSDWSAAG